MHERILVAVDGSRTSEAALGEALDLAGGGQERSIHDEYILPRMDEWDAFPRVAAAAGMTAQAQGIARLRASREQLEEGARKVMREARETVQVLMREGLIPAPPGPES